MKIIDEFKTFISRGNVIDMAVGVVMGTAFTKIVNSLVTNIITPAISIITGKVNVASLAYVINENVSIKYGEFIQAIIDFLLIAISVFIMIKIMNKLKSAFARKQEEKAEEAPPVPPADIILLEEIRDLLKADK